MRQWIAVFLGITFLLITNNAFSFSEDCLEINLNENRIKLVNLNVGGYIVNGNVAYNIKKENGSLLINLESKEIKLLNEKETEKSISWVKLRLVKTKNIVFINHFSSSQLTATGLLDLERGELKLNVSANWHESSKYLQGNIKLKAKLWGRFSDFLTSGSLTVKKGYYQGNEFDNLRMDFFGKLPLLNITDSEVILSDGSILEIEGSLNLSDSSNMMPGAEFIAQKIVVDGWQLFSAKKSEIGLKKNIDEKIGVSLNAGREEECSSTYPKTELRYNWQGDNFLKLRVDEEETTFGIEKRRDF